MGGLRVDPMLLVAIEAGAHLDAINRAHEAAKLIEYHRQVERRNRARLSVRALIELLAKCDPDALVMLSVEDGEPFGYARQVENLGYETSTVRISDECGR